MPDCELCARLRGGTLWVVFLALITAGCGGVSRPSSAPSGNLGNAPSPSSSPKFYVSSTNGNDGNDGSAERPWATLMGAAARIGPGAMVHVAPGRYDTAGEMRLGVSGRADARVVFLSDQKFGAQLRSSAGANSTVVWIQGDYVDFVGFDVAGQGSMGIYVTGSHVRVVSNHVHHVHGNGCSPGAGILNGNFTSGQDVDIIGNLVHDIGNPDQPCEELHGIYQGNPGGVVWNNVVYRTSGWGIHSWHNATAQKIANNTVVQNGYGGILVGAGDGGGTNSGSVISNNVVFQNGLRPRAKGFGIAELGNVGSNSYDDNLVSENGPGNWGLRGNAQGRSIDRNPQLDGNFQPSASSPVIGAGEAGGPTYDFNGAARPSNSVDLGAYQHGSEPAWPYSW